MKTDPKWESVRATGTRILIQHITDVHETESGLLLNVGKIGEEETRKARVVSVGEQAESIGVVPGDIILIARRYGWELPVEPNTPAYMFVEAEWILAALDPPEEGWPKDPNKLANLLGRIQAVES